MPKQYLRTSGILQLSQRHSIPRRKLVEIRNGPSLERLIFQKYFLIFPFENLKLPSGVPKQYLRTSGILQLSQRHSIPRAKIGRNQKWAQSWTAYISKIFFNISLWKPYNCPVECQSNICAQVEFSNYLNGIRFPVRKLVEIRNGPSLERLIFQKYFLIFPFENLIIAQWSAKAIFAHKWNSPIISTAFDSPCENW